MKSKRKIKKYDLVVLTHKESRCRMGTFLVLQVKPECVKLFSVSSLNILDYTPKEFLNKYEVRFYG